MIKFNTIITETRYSDYKNDTTATTKQKINNNITEVNRLLLQVENLITHAKRLKTETSSDQKVFYKKTFSRFG